MNLEELFKDRSKEEISAFAFSTAKMFEEAIRVASNNAVREKKELEAKILAFRQLLTSDDFSYEKVLQEFDRHFNIQKH